MALLEYDDPGPLVAPVLIVSFDGWVNAGSAGSGAAEHFIGDGDVVGRFDGDALFDYRAARPVVQFADGVMETVEFPEVKLYRREASGRDLLILTGTEPNWNWQTLGREIATLAAQVGVVTHVSLGGVPWAIPHTRPMSVIETASRADLMAADADHLEGAMRAPASVMSAIEMFVADRGIPTYGFWARVPHYVGATYWPAVVALVDYVGIHLDVSVPYGSLLDDAAEQRQRLDEILEAQPEVKAIVERLEEMNPEGEPSGDELAAEIERFLQQQRGDGDEGWVGGSGV